MQALFVRWKSFLWPSSRCVFTKGNADSRLYSSKSGETQGSTVNQQELEKFNALSSEWWLAKGEFTALRAMNTLRVPFIRDGLLSASSKNVSPEQKTSLPLKGFKILDVGCGGGLLSEPLARLGASVIGLDPSSDNIKIAKEHADLDEALKENLTYLCGTVEDISRNGRDFDAIVCSEVIEHVDYPELFVQSCVNVVKNGGSLFFTTINRTYASYGAAIIAAEHVLNIVPKGTHSWEKFIKPDELENMLKNEGCDLRSLQGMTFNPMTYSWSWSFITAINYALHVVKIK